MTSTASQYSAIGGKTYTSCTHKPGPVFSHGGVDFVAGVATTLASRAWTNKTLILNNGATNKIRPTPKASPVHCELDSKLAFLMDPKYTTMSTVDEVYVDWKDFGIPPVGKDYWEYIWTQIQLHGYKTVACTCLGGHGRTGTALSAMYAVAKGVTGSVALNFVRSEYCKSAVETAGQEEYLVRTFGGSLSEIQKRGSYA